MKIGYYHKSAEAKFPIAPCPISPAVTPPISLTGPLRRGFPRLAVLLPTRGLLFSQSLASILREVESLYTTHDVSLFLAHGLPIPLAQDTLVGVAVKWGAALTWLVEEDNVMPRGVLLALLSYLDNMRTFNLGRAGTSGVVSCGYFNHQGTGWVVPPWHKKMAFHAFGCTLVTREVWKLIHKLRGCYCRKGYQVAFTKGRPHEDLSAPFAYGGQDIAFSYDCHVLGVLSSHLPGKSWRAGHQSVRQMGSRDQTNDGSHDIQTI